MSSLRWLRFISPAYRYALKAEAEGRYIEAARAYAVVGESLKVAEMHILEAECQGAPASALRELHVASHFIDEAADSRQGRALLLRLGQIYLRILKKSVLTPAEHEVCAFAAELLLRAGDPRLAAQAYELAGDLTRAAQAYEQAGEIESVEALHERLAQQRRAQSEEQELWQSFELHRDLGQRREALACLDRLCQVARDPSAAHEQRAALRARLLSPHVVRLRLRQHGHEAEVVCVGRLPLRIGRGQTEPSLSGSEASDRESAPPSLEPRPDEAALPGLPHFSLSDPGLSRSHAQIERLSLGESAPAATAASQASGAPARFALRDLGSKNGSSLSGLPIAAMTAVPLRGSGELGLGQHVRLRYVTPAGGDSLLLSVTRGLARGLHLWLGEQPFFLRLPLPSVDAITAASPSTTSDEPLRQDQSTSLTRQPAGVSLRFARDDGQPWLESTAPVVLNGKPVAPQLQLLRGDVLRVADALAIEVL